MTEQRENTTAADSTPELSEHELNDQMAFRAAKRKAIEESGVSPYPVGVGRTHSLAEVRAGYEHLEAGEETEDVVTVAGRVIHVRNTGKLCFGTLQEGGGTRLQVMISKANVGEDAWRPGRPGGPGRLRGRDRSRDQLQAR